MAIYRYSQWDGSQALSWFDTEQLMDELSEHLLYQSDVDQALQTIIQQGIQAGDDRLRGIQELIQQLRSARQRRIEKYDIRSVLEDIKERLQDIVGRERRTIETRLGELEPPQDEGERPGRVEHPGEEMTSALRRVAEKKLGQLVQLPPDPAGQIRSLRDYEFLDQQAGEDFRNLLETLEQGILRSFKKEVEERLQSLSAEDKQRMKEMLRELNRMLRERSEGIDPEFAKFMGQFGDFFPSQPRSLDELVEHIQRQIAQLRSLLDSMPQEMRQALEQAVAAAVTDDELRGELERLAAGLEYLTPMRKWRNWYPFRGDEPLSFTQALELMEELQRIDDLEKQLRRTQQGAPLQSVDQDSVQELLGPEAGAALERLRGLAQQLERAGYIERTGNRAQLTPRGMRRIGQKALRDVFAYMKKERFGKHTTEATGGGGDRTDDTKRYEFGDSFDLHLERTLRNALHRRPTIPLTVNHDDFEVYRMEYLTQASTVLMLDLSWSMVMKGSFFAAKRVALALYNLIRTQFPRDRLFVVGFSTYARTFTCEQLPYISWDQSDPYTNMQQGFLLSRKLLSRERSANRQIVLISDGEPTAHTEGGQFHLGYPPSPRTLDETLREVKRCTQQGIIINTFMLDRSYYLMEFVNEMARINRGRVFYTSPEKLGQYLLVDYITAKRKRIS